MEKLKELVEQKRIYCVLRQALLGTSLLLALTACSLDANIDSLSKSVDVDNLNRKEPDFITGEVVTSGNFILTGVFGEISEKTTAINNPNWEFEGVFYE